ETLPCVIPSAPASCTWVTLRCWRSSARLSASSIARLITATSSSQPGFLWRAFSSSWLNGLVLGIWGCSLLAQFFKVFVVELVRQRHHPVVELFPPATLVAGYEQD